MKAAAAVSRKPRRRWGVHALAVLALLAQLMLPVAAFAAASGPAGARVPVCTGAGIVWMDVGTEAPARENSGDVTTMGHCPLCFATAAPAIAAPGPDIAFHWQMAAVARSVPKDSGAITRPARAPHLIRAPPVSA